MDLSSKEIVKLNLKLKFRCQLCSFTMVENFFGQKFYIVFAEVGIWTLATLSSGRGKKNDHSFINQQTSFTKLHVVDYKTPTSCALL